MNKKLEYGVIYGIEKEKSKKNLGIEGFYHPSLFLLTFGGTLIIISALFNLTQITPLSIIGIFALFTSLPTSLYFMSMEHIFWGV